MNAVNVIFAVQKLVLYMRDEEATIQDELFWHLSFGVVDKMVLGYEDQTK